MMKYVESGSSYSHSVGYEYDTLNNLNTLAETINGTTRTTSYEYDADNRVTKTTNSGSNKDSTADDIAESYTYDSYGRIQTKITTCGSTEILTETYAYVGDNTNVPSTQVKSITTEFGDSTVIYEYAYDSNGNITSVKETSGGSEKTTTYVYDSANQLIRENNQAAGITWVYTYDDAGNMLSKTEYAYTTGTLGSAIGGNSYGYGDSSWGDLMTVRNSATFDYDEVGNLVNDRGFIYTWEHGRQLSSLTGAGITWRYTYDANGMRSSRTDGTTTYNYVYNGGSLSQLTVDGHTMRFTYDASGRPLSLTYDGTEYYYALNLQGDVVAILNGGGSTVVAYTYDAWGNMPHIDGSLKDTLGFYNPLRYRGYVYDNWYGMYYLQSRYYIPRDCRFLNADAVYDYDAGLQGYNLFIYCGNNPVNRIDISGADSLQIDEEEINLGDKENAGGATPSGGNKTAEAKSNTNGRTYSTPSGGGGVSFSISVGGTTVTFGHGGRRMGGNDISDVETFIANDVINKPPSTTGSTPIIVEYQGQILTYRYFTRSDNLINVGTYFFEIDR